MNTEDSMRSIRSQLRIGRNAAVLTALLLCSSILTGSCMFIPALLSAMDTKSSGKGLDSLPNSDYGSGEITGQDAQTALREIDFLMFESNVASDTLSLHLSVKDPASLGIDVPDVTLGEVSTEENEKITSDYQNCLDELLRIDYDSLTREDQVTFDVLSYDLEEGVALSPYYYYSSSFNSITGIQTELPLVMSEYTFASRSDVEDYLLLLKDFYRYYGEMMDFEKIRSEKGLAPTDENINKIIDSCRSFMEDQDTHFLVTSFAERLADVPDLTDAEKSDFIARNQEMLDKYVFPSYQLLIDGFTSLLGTGKNDGGLKNFKDGDKYYELLLQADTSSDASVDEIKSMIENEINSEISSIQAVNYDAAFEDAYNSYDFSKGSVKENLDFCKDLIGKDFPTLPEHTVTLREVPSQLGEYFSPAAYLSCRVDDPKNNIILTNPTALDGYNNLLETIAHEGYPGHLYEGVYHSAHITSLYQRTASFTGYSEGWAEYAAAYVMARSGYDQELVGYVSDENQIFNMLFPSRIDIGVNYDGWTREDVYQYLEGYNLDMKDYADYCYDMATEIPGYYLPYCVGHIETANIIENAASEYKGTADLEEIHEAYLDIGPAPFQIIKNYIGTYIEDIAKAA